MYFIYICNFQTLIYEKLGTLKSTMPSQQSLQPDFLPYFLLNQRTLLNT